MGPKSPRLYLRLRRECSLSQMPLRQHIWHNTQNCLCIKLVLTRMYILNMAYWLRFNLVFICAQDADKAQRYILGWVCEYSLLIARVWSPVTRMHKCFEESYSCCNNYSHENMEGSVASRKYQELAAMPDQGCSRAGYQGAIQNPLAKFIPLDEECHERVCKNTFVHPQGRQASLCQQETQG